MSEDAVNSKMQHTCINYYPQQHRRLTPICRAYGPLSGRQMTKPSGSRLGLHPKFSWYPYGAVIYSDMVYIWQAYDKPIYAISTPYVSHLDLHIRHLSVACYPYGDPAYFHSLLLGHPSGTPYSFARFTPSIHVVTQSDFRVFSCNLAYTIRFNARPSYTVSTSFSC
jgi:hypothetical protein